MGKQPRDDANAPIPVLSFRYNKGHQVPFSATANLSSAFSSSVNVVTLYTTEDCFIEVGSNTIVANTSNSHFIPSGMVYDISLDTISFAEDNTKYISVVAATTGILYISERE